ncbi:flagellin N-terminal helical domain-containing protein [Scatolibacter rhodanostii]|uniref:flagellin N-terminal helical domain-containing protein n=1 Tax=Scatolibacter rhodanostii TaxID=2014781 RepID=UPI000C089C87
MVVRSNVMAMNANRQLSVNNNSVAKSLEKLSSGFRINRAADDASGLAISEKMKAQIKGLEQASANSQDGISLIQTAEGATQEIHNMLNRMVELATKSANGTIQNEVDRAAIQNEVNDLNSEISRIAQSTNFNGINLLDGNLSPDTKKDAAVTGTGITTDAGDAAVAASNTYTIGAAGATAATGVTVAVSGVTNPVSVTLADGASANDTAAAVRAALSGNADVTALYDVTGADDEVILTAKTAGAGAAPTITLAGTGTLPTSAASDTVAGAAATAASNATDSTTFAADSKITIDGKEYSFKTDADGKDGKTFSDFASLTTAAAKNSVTLTGTASSFTAEATGKALKLQVGDTNAEYNHVSVKVADLSAKGLGLVTEDADGNDVNIDVSTQDAAGAAIADIKTAINTVSTNRANLGSLQNRLDYTISNLDTTAENMTSANSRIRDTDMAKEMMNYTKMNILTQAAQSMLAQANQQPQAILQLLQ